MGTNQEAYSDKDIVARYAKYKELQAAELKIFELCRDQIAGKVLDIGIGGGRTTAYLVTQAQHYTGVDFAQPMVDLCQTQYGTLPNVHIQYADARDMSSFADQSFDFILFSYNGIDYVDLDGRNKILAECTRVLRKGGVLCFSFHNKGNLDMLYSFQYPRNPFKYLWEWRRMNQVRAINGDKEQYRQRDWFIIKDGGEDFTADTFYISPSYQQQQLEQIGYGDFHFYNAQSGGELSGASLSSSDTPWIYVTAVRS